MKIFEFLQCQTDHTTFVKSTYQGKKAHPNVYIDDIFFTSDHTEEIDYLNKLLAQKFEMKDLGQLDTSSYKVACQKAFQSPKGGTPLAS